MPTKKLNKRARQLKKGKRLESTKPLTTSLQTARPIMAYTTAPPPFKLKSAEKILKAMQPVSFRDLYYHAVGLFAGHHRDA